MLTAPLLTNAMRVQKIAAQDGSLSEEELSQRLAELVALLPGIEARLSTLKPDILARRVRRLTA
jgi:hypothetical protein